MPSPRWIHSFVRPSVADMLGVLAMATSLALAIPARAEDPDWPRQFDSPSGSFVIYQPQPEDLKGDLLTGRAAFSLKKGDANRTFGVLWYTEQIEIDRDSSTVTARSLDVTKVRLPGITADEASRYEELVETQAAGWDLSGSLEELQAGLAAAEKERASVAGIDNTPPKILFHNRRAILVVYDGSPAIEPIEGSKLQRAVNTPYAVVYDPGKHYYYLNGANLWYRAKDPLGPWNNIPSPPTGVREIVPPDTSSNDQVEGTPPEVLTATEPTELIATDGAPRYAPLVEDELLYLANTESDVILEVSTQDLYVLISGRWFRAPSKEGPWAFVRGDELPQSFKKVPLDSPKGNILASVAGTDQAEDAIADAEIPQTSAIQRDDESFEATYDGDPQFEPIEGTDLEYAVNTDAEVILADGRYYGCDQGVWYISDDPDGPWTVSDTRPLDVEDIPPSCPVYDVRYVYTYGSTPDVVYVGYLPGYLGCYPYYGTLVYGTGHRYHSWRSRDRYYAHRFTWGFQARYNPWLNRWSFGFSYGSGFLRVGSRWRSDSQVEQNRTRSTWFGAGGYRRPLVAKDMSLLRTRSASRVRTRVSDGLPSNLYNRTENVARIDPTLAQARMRSIAAQIARPAPVPNDVFAGKDGKVYRREPTGTWQVRSGRTWKQTKLPVPPPDAPPVEVRERASQPSSVPSKPDVGRDRKRPAIERSMPQRGNAPERPRSRSDRSIPSEERPTPPSERSTPPSERPTPGNLEREYRARQRADRKDASEDSEEPRNRKAQEPQKEKPQQRSREDARPERSR